MTTSTTSIPGAVRERIAIVRVLCIGFMIYVHVPDNAVSAVSSAGVPPLSLLFQGFLVEGVGRASAALLSLVSGLLTAVALSRGGAVPLYRRRLRSIIVPMLIWSSLTVALYALISVARPTFLTLDGASGVETLLHRVNAVFFLSDQPLGPTLHLGFLRDLFVCILLAPTVLAATRRVGAFVPLAFGALYLLDVESVVILRPLVLFAFSIGLWLAVRGTRLDRLDRAWPLWVVLSVLATSAVMLSGTERALDSAAAAWFAGHGLDLREVVVYPASRLFGGLAIWTLAAKLVGTAWNARLTLCSPYVFVAFCSHFLVLTFLWEGAVRPLTGSSTSAAYALWFALAPFVAMLAAAAIVEVTARLAPPLARLLTGGRPSAPRLPPGRPAREARLDPARATPPAVGEADGGARERHRGTRERADIDFETLATEER